MRAPLLAAMLFAAAPAFAQDAVPLEDAASIPDPRSGMLGELRDELGRRAPKLGLRLEESEGGPRVVGVEAGGPAAWAGLREGDVITGFCGGPSPHIEAIRTRLGLLGRGDDLSFEVQRGGEALSLQGRLGRRVIKLLGHKTGRIRLGVILLAFSDEPRDPEYKPEFWQRAMFSRGEYSDRGPSGEAVFGSMADYYDEVSAGRMRLEGEVFDGVELPGTRASYDALKPEPFRGQRRFLHVALDRLIAREGAGVLERCDAFAFVIPGGRGTFGSVLWPHSSVLLYRGQVLDYYVMEAGDGRFAGIGTHCHEFGHVLGLPDLYGVAGRAGLGCFCAMAVGHRGFPAPSLPLDAPEKSRREVIEGELKEQLEGARKQLEKLFGGRAPADEGEEAPKPRRILVDRRPLHFSAPMKEDLGWIDPVVLDPRVKQRISLPAVEGRARHAVAKVLLNERGDEYYLLEYREQRGFDRGFPHAGLLIWHVGDLEAPLENFVPFRFLGLEKAHGSDALDGAYRAPAQVPFGEHSQSRFTPETRPSSKGTRPGAWEVWITDIREVDGRLELTLGR